jgi:hypothetical protein
MATKAKIAIWDSVLRSMVENDIIPTIVNRVLVWGPPRTGKTSLIVSMFPDVERITLHRQMPVDDLLGGFVLVDGRSQWQDGVAVRALRHGKTLLVDEINNFSSECVCSLYAIGDDPAVAGVTLPTGERVKAAKGFALFATMNATPSALPDALYDRFDVVLKADTLSHGLQKALGEFVEPAKSVVGAGGSYEWSRPASVNLYIAAKKLRTKGVTDNNIAECLGLTGTMATDFLAAINDRWTDVGSLFSNRE